MNLSKHTAIVVVDNGFIYELQKADRYHTEFLSRVHTRKPLYVRGSGMFGEVIYSGITSTDRADYIIVELDNQTNPVVIRQFKGSPAILIDIENCYLIINKQVKR